MAIYRDPSGYPRMKPTAYWTRGDPTICVFRLLMWLAWGGCDEEEEACHMACDNRRCLNPFHGRAGSRAENRRENGLIKEWRACWRLMPAFMQRRLWKERRHPSCHLLALQGFDKYRSPAIFHVNSSV